jgi:hypothetical protein
MRRAILVLVSLLAVLGAVAPGSASAASGAPPDVEPPLFKASNPTAVPRGFRIDALQAIAVAETAPEMKAIHRGHHPLEIRPYVWAQNHYEIYFYFRGKVIADQTVGPNGQLMSTYTGPLILGIYARGHYGQTFDSPWVLVPFTLMFLLPLVLLRGRSWLDRFDIAVLLTWGVSYALFDTGHLEVAVWLFYPPLIYLLVRMLMRGARSRPLAGRLDCRIPTAVLVLGVLALAAGRIVVALDPAHVIDVGVASSLGAYKILHGQSLYYFSLGHGDTYGPLAYLAYVPFQAIWSGSWQYLPSARAASITFDLMTIASLVLLGARLRPGRAGWRLGLLLAWLWAACPFSVLDVEKSTNDGLVALIVVLMMLSLSAPIKRGVLVGIGAAAKFFPAILLPLVAVGRGDSDGLTVRKVLAAFVVTVGASFALFLPSGGIKEVWDHTIGYQLTRDDISSIWALHSTLAPVKVALEVGAAFLAVLVAFRPRGPRTPAQVSALAAAVIIAVQLPALHWFYLYIVWFLPLVLIAVLAADVPVAGQPPEGGDAPELERSDAVPVLAGTA